MYNSAGLQHTQRSAFQSFLQNAASRWRNVWQVLSQYSGAAVRLHLALFYFYGLYYHWSKRATGQDIPVALSACGSGWGKACKHCDSFQYLFLKMVRYDASHTDSISNGCVQTMLDVQFAVYHLFTLAACAMQEQGTSSLAKSSNTGQAITC